MKKLALDTNLLVLLIAGLTEKHLLGRHKRLRAYSEADFDLLCGLIEGAQKVVVTPHVLAETSNLLGQDHDPTSQRLRRTLARLVETQEELHTPCIELATNTHFNRLGVADCGLLSVLDKETILLTADLELYLVAASIHEATMNFNHLRLLG